MLIIQLIFQSKSRIYKPKFLVSFLKTFVNTKTMHMNINYKNTYKNLTVYKGY
jgi:hypothetical protein